MQPLAVAVPVVPGAARHSAAMSGVQLPQSGAGAFSASLGQRWPGPERLRLTGLIIRREAPRATPYIRSSASLHSRTSGDVHLAVNVACKLGSNLRSSHCGWMEAGAVTRCAELPVFQAFITDFL